MEWCLDKWGTARQFILLSLPRLLHPHYPVSPVELLGTGTRCRCRRTSLVTVVRSFNPATESRDILSNHLGIMPCTLESLPNELLDMIVSHLQLQPPSFLKLCSIPDRQLTKSEDKPLKNLSQCSRRFNCVVRPWLFICTCVDLDDLSAFLWFLWTARLTRRVRTVVVTTDNPWRDDHSC